MVNDKCDPPSKTVGTTEGTVKLEASERQELDPDSPRVLTEPSE